MVPVIYLQHKIEKGLHYPKLKLYFCLNKTNGIFHDCELSFHPLHYFFANLFPICKREVRFVLSLN